MDVLNPNRPFKKQRILRIIGAGVIGRNANDPANITKHPYYSRMYNYNLGPLGNTK